MNAAAGTRTAYRLNVNKTKLYALAKRRFPKIPPMKKTAFIKYPRVRDYGLDFRLGDVYHHLFLSVCGGRPTLADKSITYVREERVVDWKTTPLTLDELRELDMVEEVEI